MCNDFYPSHNNTKPLHVGIIPDGARRWAKLNDISYLQSYKISMSKLLTFCNYLFNNGTREISIYFSSIQNFKRSHKEIQAFSIAEEEFMKEFINNKNNDIKIKVFGNKEVLPDYFIKTINEVEYHTKDNLKKTINLCVAYNSIDEIKYAIRTSFDYEKLWIKTPLDIVIRTGDANLLSNFLPLQSAFARLYFPKKLFNDLSIKDLEKILINFSKINRIFGE